MSTINIQSGDLRVGNWVKISGLTVQLGTELFCLIITNKIVPPTPIELTPTILEDCGFRKDEKSQYGGYVYKIAEDEEIRIVNSYPTGWNWPLYGNTPVIITSLHQLQNLIHSLTGKEIEYKHLK